jgi:hypothetical protein
VIDLSNQLVVLVGADKRTDVWVPKQGVDVVEVARLSLERGGATFTPEYASGVHGEKLLN